MLHEEIEKFEKLTGLIANDFSMDYLGGFWQGYEIGKAEAKPADAERNDLTYSQGFYDGFMTAKELITKEPEKRQGEWLLLRTNYEDSGNNFYKCSICHYSDIHADSAEVPFCWHCGAKMKVGQAVQQNETK